jgi:hypothetical protein
VDGREVAQAIVAEPFVILGGVALLAEAPADPSDPNTPMVVTVNGSPRARVIGAPAPGQFRVRVWVTSPVGPEWKPELEFNAADEGLSGTCSYYGVGTISTRLRWDSWQAFLDPLVGVLDEATLNAIAPPSSDRNQPGRDGRTARLADGSWWESDGVVWKPWVGGGKLSGAQVAGATLGVTQDTAYTPPGAPQSGDTSGQSTLGVSADAAYGQPGAVSEPSTLGTTQDASYSALSFESSLAPYSAAGTTALSTAQAHSGTHSVLVPGSSAGGNANFLSRAVTLPASGVIQFSRWFRVSGAINPGGYGVIFGLTDTATAATWLSSTLVWFGSGAASGEGLYWYGTGTTPSAAHFIGTLIKDAWYRVDVSLDISNSKFSYAVYDAAGSLVLGNPATYQAGSASPYGYPLPNLSCYDIAYTAGAGTAFGIYLDDFTNGA